VLLGPHKPIKCRITIPDRKFKDIVFAEIKTKNNASVKKITHKSKADVGEYKKL